MEFHLDNVSFVSKALTSLHWFNFLSDSSTGDYYDDYSNADPSNSGDYYGDTSGTNCGNCNGNIGNVNRPSSGFDLNSFFDFGGQSRNRFRNSRRRPQNFYSNWMTGSNGGNNNPFGLLFGLGQGSFDFGGNSQDRRNRPGWSGYRRSRFNNLRSGNRQMSSNCFDFLF